MNTYSEKSRDLYDPQFSQDSCGVGFITHKQGVQTHDLLLKTHEALCTIPHRGGMNSEGVGDGAGVNIDLSIRFFRKLTGIQTLMPGHFGVANFFYPHDHEHYDAVATQLVESKLAAFDLPILLWRDVAVDHEVLNTAARQAQLPIKQVVFGRPPALAEAAQDVFENHIHKALLAIEGDAFARPELSGFYPCSMSSRTLVYKGRLNSFEVVPYFMDLADPEHEISTLFFHTRFSTNTAPATMMAQPFRYMAHNGELNTDRKNRLSENAIARQHGKHLSFPEGQSDSARLDQTLTRRIHEDGLDIVTAILAMMPPAWENDATLSPQVRAMLEYFSLYEEKNDGPAALVFSDGIRVGARLDRLGLRPLRTVETHEYLAVMSEAGQIDFPPESIVARGRIEAGGMLYFDHSTGETCDGRAFMERLAGERDYQSLLDKHRIRLTDLPAVELDGLNDAPHSLTVEQRHVAYSLDQESFKLLLDPMLVTGMEKVSAMGYGLAINALNRREGGMSRYFSQRFAQVTNPPLDSIRERDGMTLRVALGAKPNFAPDSQQIVLDSPVLQRTQLTQIRRQSVVPSITLDALFKPDYDDAVRNEWALEQAVAQVCDQVETAAQANTGIIILSDAKVSVEQAAIPALLIVAAANQLLIEKGLRFNSSLVLETGQSVSTHGIATALGFGASAVCPLTVQSRIESLYSCAEWSMRLSQFQKAVEKSLMKTIGKFGLCTIESYIGGEFFESNYLDTTQPCLKRYFPNIDAPVGGARFADVAASAAEWHQQALMTEEEKDVPLLGLFKERQDGAGHTFGSVSVREFINMTDEPILYTGEKSPEISDAAYQSLGYDKLTPEQIDHFGITPAYRHFIQELYRERQLRPAALRDIMGLPADVTQADTVEAFDRTLGTHQAVGNLNYLVRGLRVESRGMVFWLSLGTDHSRQRLSCLATHLQQRFQAVGDEFEVHADHLNIRVKTLEGALARYLGAVRSAPEPVELAQVQAAHAITPIFTSGAMSHGALLGHVHEAVAQGINIAGGISNSGEGGEHASRFNTIRSCKIKQFASGRFGVWAGYLADPNIEEIEIKIAQGAKPGEGGQLPAAKVTVEIAALRGGTPRVELVSPPPHHDTYSIEDLGQLIHDCKAARVKVIVKLVSSEGIGTIAVGVAKAGADVINVAGNTGGTGAAQVTSLKNTGRSAEIGIAEVHQALSVNGIRDKVVLRCSAAHQSGLDVIKSAILGADSFEFGTTALMMLRCVMAKNCNVKCPAGLTTPHEEFKGDARALAQFFVNMAHEVREILACLGYTSLEAIRGQTDLLHLVRHPNAVGQLDFTGLLKPVQVRRVSNPVYLEANFDLDNQMIHQVRSLLIEQGQSRLVIDGSDDKLNNRHKTVGGQLAIDIERLLNYELSADQAAQLDSVYVNEKQRRYFRPETVVIKTAGSAGQSYAAFLNEGMHMIHSGTCNDGVGKGVCGGIIAIQSPGGGGTGRGENVLIGNFALFGATGGKTFVNGEAGDRFGVRNSGAMAVVEGVGDFACEYMTNGAVLNLGGFGKGFCNGMSGGNAYQYDPDNLLEGLCDGSSVQLSRLSGDSELALAHESFVLYMLEQHVHYTGSSRARDILDNWQTERQAFRYAEPLWLYKTQAADYLLESIERKAMIEELAPSIALAQLRHVKQAYEQSKPLFDGDLPAHGETDTPLTFQLINRYAVIQKAEQVIALQSKTVTLIGQELGALIRQLIVSESRSLQDVLSKDAREALADYSDRDLSILLADKRLRDYKQALTERDVQDLNALGSTAWILYQGRQNRQALSGMTDVEAFLAVHSSHAIIQAMLQTTSEAA